MSAVSNQCFCLDDADPQLFVAERTSRGGELLEQRRSFGRTFSFAVEPEQPVWGGAEPIGDPAQSLRSHATWRPGGGVDMNVREKGVQAAFNSAGPPSFHQSPPRRDK